MQMSKGPLLGQSSISFSLQYQSGIYRPPPAVWLVVSLCCLSISWRTNLYFRPGLIARLFLLIFQISINYRNEKIITAPQSKRWFSCCLQAGGSPFNLSFPRIRNVQRISVYPAEQKKTPSPLPLLPGPVPESRRKPGECPHWAAPRWSLPSESQRPHHSSPRFLGLDQLPQMLDAPFGGNVREVTDTVDFQSASFHHLVGSGCPCCSSSGSHFRWLWSHISFCGKNCLAPPVEHQKTIGFSKTQTESVYKTRSCRRNLCNQ